MPPQDSGSQSQPVAPTPTVAPIPLEPTTAPVAPQVPQPTPATTQAAPLQAQVSMAPQSVPAPQGQSTKIEPSQALQSLQQLAQAVPYEPHYDPAKQPPPAYENIYTEICTEIIKAQSKIMGMDLAIEQAQGVQGLSVDPQTLHSTVTGDGSKVINDLIQQFKNFFGYAAVEVCREATATLLTRLPLERTPVLLHPQQS